MMKKLIPILIIFFLSIFLPYTSYSTVFTAVASTNWNLNSTWDQNAIPGSLDTVVIDGYQVTLNAGIHEIKRLVITNASGTGISILYLDDSGQLTVTQDLEVTAEKVTQDVEVKVLSSSSLIVNNNATFSRASNNNKINMLRLTVKNFSLFSVGADFTFNYQNSSPSEVSEEILIENWVNFNVTGNMYLNLAGGNDFNLNVKGQASLSIDNNLVIDNSNGDNFTLFMNGGSDLTVGGDITLNNSGGLSTLLNLGNSSGTTTITGNTAINSTTSNKLVEMEVSGNSSPNFLGNINLSGVGNGDVLIDLKGGSYTNIKGNITRTSFGALNMESASTVNFNGSNQQTIPSSTKSGSSDVFSYSNILINNISGLPMLMEGPLSINTNLNLQSGSIKTTSANIITLEDGATISGASETNFIDGPMIKKGTTNLLPFTFPTGKDGTYAPITISAVTNASSEIRAEYFGDPPPWGDNLTGSINNINGNNYWSIDKNAGSDVNVTIHWNADIAGGITELNDLVVARLDETSGSEIWENYGSSSRTGTTTTGTVTSNSLMGDPPPWGDAKFTLGSVSALNALPVELTKFLAIQQSTQVYMQWETASERNTSHFEIERSNDGFSFESIGNRSSNGDTNIAQHYSYNDVNPKSGLNYYRLKIVDLDGSFEYSHIEVVKYESTPSIELYPNPIKEVIHLKTENLNSEENLIEIFDRTGKLLFMDVLEFENGVLNLDAERVNIYENGTYFLRISGKTENQILKFIKIK